MKCHTLFKKAICLKNSAVSLHMGNFTTSQTILILGNQNSVFTHIYLNKVLSNIVKMHHSSMHAFQMTEGVFAMSHSKVLVSALRYCDFKILSNLYSVKYVISYFLIKSAVYYQKSLRYYELTAKFTAVKLFSHHCGLATQVSQEVSIQVHARMYIHITSEISQ